MRMTATQVHLLGLLLMRRIFLQLKRRNRPSPPVNRVKKRNITLMVVARTPTRPPKKGQGKNRGGTSRNTVPANHLFQNAPKKGTEVLHSVAAGNGQQQVASLSQYLHRGVDAGGSGPQKNPGTTGGLQSAQSEPHAPGVGRKRAVMTSAAQRGLDRAAMRERTQKSLGQKKDKINQ